MLTSELTKPSWQGDSQNATADTSVPSIGTAKRGGPFRQRLLYIDNLRIGLTGLVVIVHAAVTYSDIPIWYYTEPAQDRSGVVMDVLVILAQTFFMGFFFLISGYFVPESYNQKGGRAFLRDRFVRLGIPTPAYMPQYASLFVIGLAACRGGWAQALPVSAGWYGLMQAVVASAAVAPVAMLASRAFTASSGTWGPALFAIWESLFAVGLIVALIVLFRQKLNRQGLLAGFMSQHAYTVYVIHPLILVGLGYALSWLHAIAIVKFTVLVALGIPLCWASAFLVRALPYARRVL